MFSSLLDNLGPGREILTKIQDNWKEWGLKDSVENLGKYIEGNQIKNHENQKLTLKENNHHKKKLHSDIGNRNNSSNQTK